VEKFFFFDAVDCAWAAIEGSCHAGVEGLKADDRRMEVAFRVLPPTDIERDSILLLKIN
jgi:hypothetical protein